jgi:hypothetical protein
MPTKRVFPAPVLSPSELQEFETLVIRISHALRHYSIGQDDQRQIIAETILSHWTDYDECKGANRMTFFYCWSRAALSRHFKRNLGVHIPIKEYDAGACPHFVYLDDENNEKTPSTFPRHDDETLRLLSDHESQVIRNAFISFVLSDRPERETEIFRARCNGQTLDEIGWAYRLSGERVRQIEDSVIHIVRRALRVHHIVSVDDMARFLHSRSAKHRDQRHEFNGHSWIRCENNWRRK